MGALGSYILSVSCASILLGILQSLCSKTSTTALVRLMGGLFLTFTVIAPAVNLDFDSLFDIPFEFREQGQEIAAQGNDITKEQLNGNIKHRCETYILDKALSCQSPLEVDIILSEDEIPIPSAVRLKGHVSPYAKQILQQWLAADMGIPKERQIWIG